MAIYPFLILPSASSLLTNEPADISHVSFKNEKKYPFILVSVVVYILIKTISLWQCDSDKISACICTACHLTSSLNNVVREKQEEKQRRMNIKMK